MHQNHLWSFKLKNACPPYPDENSDLIGRSRPKYDYVLMPTCSENHCSSGFQNMVFGPVVSTSPGNLLEMPGLGPTPDLLNWKAWRSGPEIFA